MKVDKLTQVAIGLILNKTYKICYIYLHLKYKFIYKFQYKVMLSNTLK